MKAVKLPVTELAQLSLSGNQGKALAVDVQAPAEDRLDFFGFGGGKKEKKKEDSPLPPFIFTAFAQYNPHVTPSFGGK